MSGIPLNEAERMLANQRQMYEAKLRQMQRQGSTATPPKTQTGSGIPLNEAERMLANQRQMYEDKLRQMQGQTQQDSIAVPPKTQTSHAAPQSVLANQRQIYETKLREMQGRTQQGSTANLSQAQAGSSNQHQSRVGVITASTPSSPQGIPPLIPPRRHELGISTTSRLSTTNQSHSVPTPLFNFSQNLRQVPIGREAVIKKIGFPPNSARNKQSSSDIQPSASTSRSKSCQRKRSASSTRSVSTSDDDEELNCPTCKNKFGLKIYRCSGGHSSCHKCRLKGANCGVCGVIITEMRNITLESYVAERTIACLNAKEGCCLSFKVAVMDAHLKECPFSEIACPVDGMFGTCTWRGKISKLPAHFDDKHPEHRQGAVDTEMRLPNVIKGMHLIEIGPFIFLVHLKVDEIEHNVFITVQLFGTPVSASKWTYEIHLYTKTNSRRHQYTDICHSHAVPVADIFKESKCMAISLLYASNFMEDGGLLYKIYLKNDFDRYKRRGVQINVGTSSEI